MKRNMLPALLLALLLMLAGCAPTEEGPPQVPPEPESTPSPSAGLSLSRRVVQEHYALINEGDAVRDNLDMLGIQQWELWTLENLPADELPALEPGDLERATHFMKTRIRCAAAAPSQKPVFSGRFWVLTDPYVYSASEQFAVFCKDSGFATLVGQRTGGDGVGTSPMICVLPNSGVVYQFSIMNGVNLDGGSNEELGTAPDIEVPEGEDALEACLRAIEEAGA